MARHDETTKEIDKRIADNVARLRRINGLSRQQLAEQIGVSHQQLQKYEKSTNRIPASRLVLISRALSIPVTVFLRDDTPDEYQKFKGLKRQHLEFNRDYLSLEPKRQEMLCTIAKAMGDL